MKQLLAIIAVAALCAAPWALAEVFNPEATVTFSTNATSTLGATITARGLLHRAIVTVTSGGTGVVELIDTDGTVIWTNATTSGTTTILTNFPANGIQVKTYGANTTNKTVKVISTVEK